MSRRLLGLFAVALSPLVAGSLRLAAQAAVQPAVTVVAFDADGSTGFSVEDRQKMADELAMRFVETGRFRVLQREWLPVPKDVRGQLPLTTLRAAATSSGVEYLVLGSVRRAGAFATPSGGPGGAFQPGFAGGFRYARPAMRYDAFLSVNVRVIEVASGRVVRTSVARANMAARGLPPAAIIPNLLLGRPAGAMVTVAALSARSSQLNGGVQHALAEIAHTLNLAATPAPHVR